jgi:hypothetical protein
MLFYSQTKGHWTDGRGAIIVSGCISGNGPDMNKPASQFVHNHGPLPQGVYDMGPLLIPRDPLAPHLGPSMRLTPHAGNNMGNPARSGFFVHLTNPQHVDASSDGCICPKNDRDIPGAAAPGLIEAQKIHVIKARRAAGETAVTVTA